MKFAFHAFLCITIGRLSKSSVHLFLTWKEIGEEQASTRFQFVTKAWLKEIKNNSCCEVGVWKVCIEILYHAVWMERCMAAGRSQSESSQKARSQGPLGNSLLNQTHAEFISILSRGKSRSHETLPLLIFPIHQLAWILDKSVMMLSRKRMLIYDVWVFLLLSWSVFVSVVYDRKSVIDNARRWKKSVCGRWGLGSSGIVLLTEYNHMGMDQYLLIPFLGGYSHPFTSYFDVHQGYKVLTHCHIVLKHCSLASLLHIDQKNSYSRSCGMCSGASTSDTSWGRSWSESQRAWTTNQRATPGVELLCAHSLEGLCFRVAVQVLTRNRKGP